MADLGTAFDMLKPIVRDKVKGPFYLFKCVYCGSTDVFALLNDGGSIQNCNRCGQTYRAKIIR
ncbi:putative orfan [Tupanvirus soda lake]|uniref:Orfan n=2 Tax=Tupanvirus TaxID=2094720 RepID=A0AC62AD15_9VIRU|nr:putative orfan [Tupanvirus soda lake]QKU35577.1 putative orfan [Tupanvirus soda lake]